MTISKTDIESAIHGDKNAMRSVLNEYNTVINSVARTLGIDPRPGMGSHTPHAKPLPGTINVTAQDGHFIVTLSINPQVSDRRAGVQGNFPPTNDPFWDSVAGGRKTPAKVINYATDYRIQKRLFHQVESSTNLAFDTSGNLKTYGPAPDLIINIKDPNVTRYWRFRSKFEDSNYTEWVYFSGVTGLIPVYSGLLSSPSLSLVNGAITFTSNQLTQSGTSSKINVAGGPAKAGNQTITYSPTAVDPGSYGTFYVYGLDRFRAGGLITPIASTSNPDITSDDGAVWFGVITTSNAGGGTGHGGGGGGCCIGDVLVTMADGSKKKTSELRKGDLVEGMDGEPDRVEHIELIPDMPCFRITAKNGTVHQGCSPTQPFQYSGGGFEQCIHLQIGDSVTTMRGASRITKKDFIGHRTVYKIQLHRTKGFIGDGFYQHNANKN